MQKSNCKHCGREVRLATTKNGVTFWASLSGAGRCARFENLRMHEAVSA